MKKLRSKIGLKKIISKLGRKGKKLFRTYPISKIRGYLKKTMNKFRKKGKIRNFIKSLRSKVKKLAKKSKAVASKFVKGLLKKFKLKLKSPFGKKGLKWEKLLGKILKGVAEKLGGDNGNGGGGGDNGNGGGGGDNGNGGEGGDNGKGGGGDNGNGGGDNGNGGGGDNGNGGDGGDIGGDKGTNELTIGNIIKTMKVIKNITNNGKTTLNGTTLLSVKFVENAFENSVIVDTIKRFYSDGVELFVGEMKGSRVVTLQTQGNEGPKLTIKSPTKTIIIKIRG